MRTIAVFCGVLLAASCGGDDGTSDADYVLMAQQKCLTFRNTLCVKADGCVNGNGSMIDLCRARYDQKFGSCDTVVLVGASYDRCIDDVTKATCTAFVATDGTIQPPASCDNLIVTKTK